MGEMRYLPLAQKLCSECNFGYMGSGGVYCIEFHQFVDEDEANVCEEYNPS